MYSLICIIMSNANAISQCTRFSFIETARQIGAGTCPETVLLSYTTHVRAPTTPMIGPSVHQCLLLVQRAVGAQMGTHLAYRRTALEIKRWV